MDTLLDTLNYLKQKPLNLLNFGDELDELHLLPDGAVMFKEANKRRLWYDIMINDKYYYQYHRNNGITKLAVKVNSQTLYLYRTIEGLISMADLLHKAYGRALFPKLFIMTGINYLPMKMSQTARIERVIHLLGTGIFPLCLSLLLPVFIYSIVYEKEQKVIEIMKMNGMKMRYYWLVNFVFDFVIYTITFCVFFIYGGAILGLEVFFRTHALLQALIIVGWGYAQIAMAFLVSPFLSRSQSATSKPSSTSASHRLRRLALAVRRRTYSQQHAL